jgi:hypothetical protein
MPRPSTRPDKMRLTLSTAATVALPKVVKSPSAWVCVRRNDGQYDVPVSAALYDQLQTAALPRENFSDTLLRLAAGKA